MNKPLLAVSLALSFILSISYHLFGDPCISQSFWSTYSEGLPITLSVSVIDGDGKPVKKARCEVFFPIWGRAGVTKISMTDSRGMVKFKERVNYGPIRLRVSSNGYYSVKGMDIHFFPHERGHKLDVFLDEVAKRGFWRDQNVKIVLKAKGKTRSAADMVAEVPVLSSPKGSCWLNLITGVTTNAIPQQVSQVILRIDYDTLKEYPKLFSKTPSFLLILYVRM